MVTVGRVVPLDFPRVPIVPIDLTGTSSKLIEDLSKHEHCAEELRELADNHWLLYAISHRSRCRPCLPRRLPRCWCFRIMATELLHFLVSPDFRSNCRCDCFFHS